MNGRKHQPWFKWYPGDWRSESRLRMVSRAARSLWVDILGLCHDAEPYGFLIVADIPLLNPAQIARALGDNEAEITPLLAELEACGVFSRVGSPSMPAEIAALVPEGVPEGVICSRKMLRNKAASDAGRANGALGGNPVLTSQQGITPVLTGMDNTQKTDTRVPLLRNGANAQGENSSNEKHPRSKPYDDKTWLFREGLPWLATGTGRAEAGLRSQLGRWLRDAKEDASAVRSAFEAAREQSVAEPLAWISATIKARAKAAAPFEPTDEHGWRQRLVSFRQFQAWPPKWGGVKPGDDPRHPPWLAPEYEALTN